MKFLTILFLSIFVFSAFANDTVKLSCTVSKVLDENVLEESLSVEEYPEVEVSFDLGTQTYYVTIGANLFDTDQGDIVTSNAVAGYGRSYSVTPSDDSSVTFTISNNSSTSRMKTTTGRLTVGDGSQTITVAELKNCTYN